jgi:hypothetical protein
VSLIDRCVLDNDGLISGGRPCGQNLAGFNVCRISIPQLEEAGGAGTVQMRQKEDSPCRQPVSWASVAGRGEQKHASSVDRSNS